MRAPSLDVYKRQATRNIIPHIVSLIIMEAALCIPYSIGSEVFKMCIRDSNKGSPTDLLSLKLQGEPRNINKEENT